MDPEAEAHLREALETNPGAADRTSAARALASLLTTGRRGNEAVEVLVRVRTDLNSVDREASLMLLDGARQPRPLRDRTAAPICPLCRSASVDAADRLHTCRAVGAGKPFRIPGRNRW